MNFFVLFAILLSLSCTGETQETKVLICKSTSAYAYHSDYCQGLKQCEAKVEKVTVEKAVELKRKPCGYCYKRTSSQPVLKSSSGSSYSSPQCSATTKRGTRCSRNSRSGGYCWQHGG